MKSLFSALLTGLLIFSGTFALGAGAGDIGSADTNTSASSQLEAWVKANRLKIEKENNVTIELESLKCVGVPGALFDGSSYGVCVVNGALNHPNSDSTFGITVYPSELESSDFLVSLKVLSGEL